MKVPTIIQPTVKIDFGFSADKWAKLAWGQPTHDLYLQPGTFQKSIDGFSIMINRSGRYTNLARVIRKTPKDGWQLLWYVNLVQYPTLEEALRALRPRRINAKIAGKLAGVDLYDALGVPHPDTIGESRGLLIGSNAEPS